MGKLIQDFRDSNGKWVKSICVGGIQLVTRSCSRYFDMNKRCKVDGAYQKRRPTYIGCTISENFKDFQHFTEWSQSQSGNNLVNYNLDKDLLIEGNKVYSEETCVFIPRELNSFLTFHDKTRGEFALGVCRNKRDMRFVSCIRKDNKLIYLGSFSTEIEAHRIYIIAKEEHAQEWYKRCLSGEVVVDSRVSGRLKDWKVPAKYRMEGC
jgi:hypothetical protein